MNRDDVYDAIDSERDFQDNFIAQKGLNQFKSVGEFLTLIRVYSNKADNAWTYNGGDSSSLEEIRKIAAICVACMENHGVKKRETRSSLSNKLTTIPYGKGSSVSSFTQSNKYQTSPSWIPVSSSNINAISYNHNNQTLSIRFKSSGEYRFYSVPSYIYDGMLKASSKGQYFHRNIRGVFQGDKVI